MKKITVWKVWNDGNQRWEHNHIEDRWVPAMQKCPIPKFTSQNWWSKAGWIKRRVHIDKTGKIIK